MGKPVSILVVACLLLAMVGCSNLSTNPETPTSLTDKYEPAIELTVPGDYTSDTVGGYDYLNNPWTKAYKEELGINIAPKWEISGTNTQILSEQLAAGVVPDLMPGLGRYEFEFVVRLGLAADLTDLIDQYAKPLTKEILYSDGGYSIQSSTIDECIYALPHVYGNTDNIPMMWIRTDWLERLGLDVPKTAEELETVLYAFVNSDPDGNGLNDTFGLCSTGSLWEFSAVFNMFGAQPFWSWYYDENQLLRYSTVSFVPQIKNALSYLQRLYQNSLIYSEFGVLPSDRYYRLFAENKAGLAFEYKYMPMHIQEDTPNGQVKAEWKAFPIPTGLPDLSPARPFSYHGPAAYNVVSSQCRNPEAAVKMLNLYVEKLYSNQKDKYYTAFVKDEQGVSIEGYAIFRMLIANDLSEFEHISEALLKRSPANLSRSEADKYQLCLNYLNGDRTKWEEYQYYGPGNATVTVINYYTTKVTPFFSDYYGPEPVSAGQHLALLNNRWREISTEIIMGGAEVVAYDAFVSEWYQLGGNKVESDVNALAAKVSP